MVDMSGSAGVASVDNGPMSNGEYADGSVTIEKLVDDPICADGEGPQPAKATPQDMSGFTLSLQAGKGFQDGV